MKPFFYCIVLQLLAGLSYAAPPVVLEQDKINYALAGHIELLIDKQCALTIDDIIQHDIAGQFKDSRWGVPNFGYTNATIWLKFTIRQKMINPGEMILEFDWPHTEIIELFIFVRDLQGNYILTKNKSAGRNIPMANWEFRHRNILFNMPPELKKTQYVFIKLKTDDSLRGPLFLWEKQAFWQHAKNEYFLLGAFYGLMFIIIFYNLLVYFTTKDISFLLFVLHIASTALFELCFNGLAYEYLWPFSPWLAAKGMPVFVFLLTGFAAVFSKQFLNLKTHIPTADKLLDIIIVLSGAGIVLLFILPARPINIYTAGLAGIYPIVLLFISFQSLRHNIPFSKHFIFIWALVLVATAIAGLTFLGVLPHVEFTNYFHQFCSALEASLFSIVLAGRINELRKQNKAFELSGIKAVRKRDEALASSKAQSAFLANMSHEIRTPINAVTGMLYLLKETELTPVQQDFTEKMHISANALLGIINDILDISKIEAGKLKLEYIDFELNSVIENVTTLVEMKTAQKNIDLVVSYDNIACMNLHGDPLRLGQILTNLVNNAVKFTDKGEVGIFCKKIDENRFKFDVTDTGIGLTQEEIGKLFQAFSQADRSTTRKYGGTGLGLTISKRLVEMMNGRIWVESHPGKGSQFSFEVPLTERLMTSPVLKTFNDKTVLIIDGSHSWRRVLEKMIGLYHAETHTVDSAEDAFAIIKQGTVGFDLILLDWHTPRINGAKTVQAINRLTRNSADIIVMTWAYHQEHVIQETRALKIAAFLLKPVNPMNFRNIMYKIFTGEAIEQPSIQGNHDPALLKKKVETLRGSHLLLVDDIELNREVICGILSGSGITIHEAENGQMALDMYRENPSLYELILMDIQMPVMDGYEATREIRRLDPDVPIIALTASVMESDVAVAIKTGATRHLSKPVEVDQLFLTLLEFISKKCDPGDSNEQSLLQTAAHINYPKTNGPIDAKLQCLTLLDVQAGLRHMNGDKALYAKLLNNFVTNYQGITPMIGELINNDRDQAVRIAHTIKGFSAGIGAKELHLIAERLEKAPDHSLLPAFDEALNKIVDQIKACRLSDIRTESENKKKGTTRQLDELWQQLSRAIGKHRPHQIKPVLEQFEKTALDRDDAELLEKVKAALAKYRFNQALDDIKQR